jgi:hypothetical protein
VAAPASESKANDCRIDARLVRTWNGTAEVLSERRRLADMRGVRKNLKEGFHYINMISKLLETIRIPNY